MTDSLDSLINNLTCDIYSTKCKHYMKCQDCKKCEKCEYNNLEWYEIHKDDKKLSNYCNEFKKFHNP